MKSSEIQNSNIVIIPEYGSEVIYDLNRDRDVAYLKKECFQRGAAPSFKTRVLENHSVEIENSSYSGIIQLEKLRLHFSTKVKSNLFYMLSFLKDEECFLYDPEVLIDVQEGESFFDVLGRLFLNELINIEKIGFYKTYVKKQDNLYFLRGKLLLRSQLKNDIRIQSRLACQYDDLTYDNPENQIILRAALLLVPLIRFNDEIRRDLMRYSQMLRDSVSLVDIVPEECNRIMITRLNQHYESIIQLSRVILANQFIRSVFSGNSKAFNFLVNMNKVYEDFMTGLIEEIVNEDKGFKDYHIDKQERFNSLVKESSIITRPDIILGTKNQDDYPLIIDAKYKKQESNADLYQVIAYALAIPTARACCLIYPTDLIDVPIRDEQLTLNTDTFGNMRPEITIHILRVNLLMTENLCFAEYVERMKSQVREKLLNILRYVKYSTQAVT